MTKLDIRSYIADERCQLISQWQRNADWLNNVSLCNITQIKALTSGAPKATGSVLRQFHDKIGFMAKGPAEKGGLCAGAIFRTQKFILTSSRVGTKNGQTVHIEHTVPINVLLSQLNACDLTYIQTIKWVLMHSVTTAMNITEPSLYLSGFHKTTRCFDANTSFFNRPFSRYERLFSDPNNSVWNVWTGEAVDSGCFSFDDNYRLIVDLLEQGGLNKSLLYLLRN